MIEITKDEINAFNILSMRIQELQGQLNQATAAQQSLINLLERKYKAVFKPETGTFEPKVK